MQRGARKREASGKAVVGVIADTHGLLRPEAVAALASVDLIVHAGDIGSAAILAELGAMAPVVAVRGNNDRDAWAASIPEIVRTEIVGCRLYVIHDLKMLAGDPEALGVDVVISGHSHRPGIEKREGVLFVNPGSAGPRRFKLPVSVGCLTVYGTSIKPRLVELNLGGTT